MRSVRNDEGMTPTTPIPMTHEEALDTLARAISTLEGQMCGEGQLAGELDDVGVYIESLHSRVEADTTDAALWRKHKDSFAVLQAMLEAASPLVLNKLKAQEATRQAQGGESKPKLRSGFVPPLQDLQTKPGLRQAQDGGEEPDCPHSWADGCDCFACPPEDAER